VDIHGNPILTRELGVFVLESSNGQGIKELIIGAKPAEGDGVFHGKPIGIVIEIDEDGPAFVLPISDFFCPCFELLFRVIGAVEHLAAVQTKIDKVSRHRLQERKVRTMGDAESEVKFLQNRQGLVAEPGFVPELKGVAEIFAPREG